MNKVDIFKKIPKFKFEEKAIKTNSKEFCKIVESRRSVRVYTDEKIPEDSNDEKQKKEDIEIPSFLRNQSN